MTEKTTSPVPATEKTAQTDTLNFNGALIEIQEGKSVTRVEWANKKIYGVLKDGYLSLHKEDDKFYQWIISGGDLTAEDWYVI